MGVYIKGMEMPDKKNGAVLIIYPDGQCAFEDGKTYQAASVPDHGRLVDADRLRSLYDSWHDPELVGFDFDKCHVPIPVIRQNIDDMPTIIPASFENLPKNAR